MDDLRHRIHQTLIEELADQGVDAARKARPTVEPVEKPTRARR